MTFWLKTVYKERGRGHDCLVLHEKGCHDLAPQVLFANVARSGFKTSITACLTGQWDRDIPIKWNWCNATGSKYAWQLWAWVKMQTVSDHHNQLWRWFQLWITSSPRRMVNRNGKIRLVQIRRRAGWDVQTVNGQAEAVTPYSQFDPAFLRSSELV